MTTEEEYLEELRTVADLSLEDMLKPGRLKRLTELSRIRLEEVLTKLGYLNR